MRLNSLTFEYSIEHGRFKKILYFIDPVSLTMTDITGAFSDVINILDSQFPDTRFSKKPIGRVTEKTYATGYRFDQRSDIYEGSEGEQIAQYLREVKSIY